MTPPFKLVRVKWRDACSYTSWAPLEYLAEREPLDCESIGYLIRQDDNCLTVVPTTNKNDEGTDCMTIPAPWVVSVQELQYVSCLDGWSSKEGC